MPPENPLDSYLSSNILAKGSISIIYNLMINQASSSLDKISFIQFKVVHRAHISKVKLAQTFPGTSSLCNRCQCAEGTLIHMFWTFPKLECFWWSIFNTLWFFSTD